ncbi:MAG: dynamin family protein [Acidimicrobiia bacterium]|nr:dynamin family protein [Acidimicrobiia bacterium]
MTDPVPSPLLSEVRALAEAARTSMPGLASEFGEVLDRIDQPLRVAIAGKVKAGKSTLLNALLGEELAASDAGECTRIVTWYQHGTEYAVTGETGDDRFPVAFSHTGQSLEIDLGARDADSIDRLLIEAPSTELRSMSLIDTPGMASLSTDIAVKSSDFLTPEDGTDTPVDAVIYLLRHLHATDVSFLHAFHDKEFTSPSPVNCLGVLSRADEIAAGRLDAMDSARRIATRYSGDQRLRRLVQGVVPVAGLIGQASATITEQQVADLRTIAALEPGPAQLALLSVERFLTDGSFDVPTVRRQTLLDLLGVFGLRLVEHNLRTGQVADVTSVRALLRTESGIDHLADTLMVMFGGRRDTLKARSALVTIQRLLDRDDHPREIAARLEQIWASAHDFSELRTLNVLRDADIGLSAEDLDTAERILGGYGTSMTDRLGLPESSSVEDRREKLFETISQWRQRSSSPIASRPLTALCDVVIRSCEGLVAQLDQN